MRTHGWGFVAHPDAFCLHPLLKEHAIGSFMHQKERIISKAVKTDMTAICSL